MAETADRRRRRLLYRSRYTGTRETDLLLGQFAESWLHTLGEAQLDEYEALIAVPDPRLYKWITGQEPPPHAYDTEVLALIRRFRPAF